jgi:hypothetical protein
MRPLIFFCIALCIAAGTVHAADPALTIYNQDFAVIRDVVPLDLHKGENRISYNGIAAHLEPESVILRDLSGRVALTILEQNYRADPVSAEMLLALFEGKTIQFLAQEGDKTEIVTGKVVRGGYAGPEQGSTPIIEVDGKLRFSLPGQPLFPALGDDSILQPTLNWIIGSDRDAHVDAELAYVSEGMTWSADYNMISSAGRGDVDLIGWASMRNNSGRTFENARIKLMAGDVNKVKPQDTARFRMGGGLGGGFISNDRPVTEKTFDEYHLYTLERPATLHDKETKQVEMIRATGVMSQQIYVYDGFKPDPNQYRGWNAEMIRENAAYGALSNDKVWVMRECTNSEANRLGMPLPAGRVRFYRRDEDGQLEFTGEDNIPHTARDETVRVFTGSSFDLVGERKRVNFNIDNGRRQIDESFEIKVRNHKREAVEIRVVEHLSRWTTWEIQLPTMPYVKTDAQTVEFRVKLEPGEEKTIGYNAHYTW